MTEQRVLFLYVYIHTFAQSHTAEGLHELLASGESWTL